MSEGKFLGVGCAAMIAVFLIIWIPISFWSQRTIEYWGAYFSGHAVHCPFWLSMIFSLVFNAIIIGINIVSEIVRLFM